MAEIFAFTRVGLVQLRLIQPWSTPVPNLLKKQQIISNLLPNLKKSLSCYSPITQN
jgi:hypothetical protein